MRIRKMLFEILYDDPELLVVNKPAGLVCHPTKTDEYSSLIGRVRLYLGTNAVAHLVNRLDREGVGSSAKDRGQIARVVRPARQQTGLRVVPSTVLADGRRGPCPQSMRTHRSRGRQDTDRLTRQTQEPCI